MELASELESVYRKLIKKVAKKAEKVFMSFSILVDAIKAPFANDYVKYNSYTNEGELINAKL